MPRCSYRWRLLRQPAFWLALLALLLLGVFESRFIHVPELRRMGADVDRMGDSKSELTL